MCNYKRTKIRRVYHESAKKETKTIKLLIPGQREATSSSEESESPLDLQCHGTHDGRGGKPLPEAPSEWSLPETETKADREPGRTMGEGSGENPSTADPGAERVLLDEVLVMPSSPIPESLSPFS